MPFPLAVAIARLLCQHFRSCRHLPNRLVFNRRNRGCGVGRNHLFVGREPNDGARIPLRFDVEPPGPFKMLNCECNRRLFTSTVSLLYRLKTMGRNS
jgi:hypothetical protein